MEAYDPDAVRRLRSEEEMAAESHTLRGLFHPEDYPK